MEVFLSSTIFLLYMISYCLFQLHFCHSLVCSSFILVSFISCYVLYSFIWMHLSFCDYHILSNEIFHSRKMVYKIHFNISRFNQWISDIEYKDKSFYIFSLIIVPLVSPKDWLLLNIYVYHSIIFLDNYQAIGISMLFTAVKILMRNI